MTGLCGSELGTCGEPIVSLDDRWKAKGMAFRVQLLDASGGTFDQYGTEGSFSVIEGGALRVHSPNGTSTVYSPNWWIKVEEDPNASKRKSTLRRQQTTAPADLVCSRWDGHVERMPE